MKMQTKCRLRSCIALTCTFAMLLSCISLQAADVGTLESSSNQLQSQLSGINNELLALSQEIQLIDMKITITSGEMARTQADLTTVEEQEAQQYEAMKARIKYMYELGDASMLQMLFSADDMTDFLNKADFIQNISDYDRQMIQELKNTQQTIVDEQTILQAQQDSFAELQKNMADKQSSLVAKAAETSTDLNTLNAQLQQARADEAAKLAAEAAAQAAAQAAASQAASSSNGEQTNGSNDTINVGGGSNVSSDELTVFAAILQCEAYSQYEYMLAVATVIMNRVNSSSFPNTITEVIYANGQFEPTWSGRLESTIANGPNDVAYQVAQDAINGARLASVSDCYYFLSSWTGHAGIDVGGNVFFQSW